MKCLGGGGGGGAVILLVSSCYGNRHSVRLEEPLGSLTDFTSLISQHKVTLISLH